MKQTTDFRYNTGASGAQSYTFQIRDSETIRLTVIRVASTYSVRLFAYIGQSVSFTMLNGTSDPVSDITVNGDKITVTISSWATYANVIIERFY